ncbi:CYTH and CHAD domain-containing protein [Rhodococcus sp. NPDC003348]
MTAAQASIPEESAETERKYDAAPDQELPPLSDLPGIAGRPMVEVQQLSAQYFDTSDYRLLRNGITLRKRTGGDDAGWHLKIPAGDNDTRTETRLPLSAGDTPPRQLTALVHGITHAHALAPIARLDTRRRRNRLLDAAGAPQADIVEDTVTAVLPDTGEQRIWTEIEVEQAGAGRTLADAIETRLLEAGIERSTHPTKLNRALAEVVTASDLEERRARKTDEPRECLRRYLQKQIRRLGLADIAVRRDEPEAVHKMRKAARRARSALQAYAPGFGLDERAQPLILDLRWLGRRLSPARDVEVQWARISTRIAESAALPGQEAVYARVNEYFSEQADTARASALAGLDSERYLTLLDALDVFVEDLATPAGSTPTAQAPDRDTRSEVSAEDSVRILKRLAATVSKRVDKAGDAATRRERGERIHRARKRAKRMRYAMEVIRHHAPKKTARALKRFNDFQDVLGEFQDSTVAREHLLAIATAHDHTAESSFGLGILHQLEQQIGDERADHVSSEWKAARKAARRLWR